MAHFMVRLVGLALMAGGVAGCSALQRQPLIEHTRPMTQEQIEAEVYAVFYKVAQLGAMMSRAQVSDTAEPRAFFVPIKLQLAANESLAIGPEECDGAEDLKKPQCQNWSVYVTQLGPKPTIPPEVLLKQAQDFTKGKVMLEQMLFKGLTAGQKDLTAGQAAR